MLPHCIARKLSGLPQHRRILSRACSILSKHRGVLGIFISGSVAERKPDPLSDLDILVVTKDELLAEVWSARNDLESAIAKVVFRIDLSEILPTSSAAYYQCGVKLHTTYQCRSLLKTDPEYRHAVALMRHGMYLQRWLTRCRSQPFTPDPAILMRDDQRFWFWLLQGAAKVQRGELWAAHDTLHLLRTICVGFVEYSMSCSYQGYRRLEERWQPLQLKRLAQCVAPPRRNDLGTAYLNVLDLFLRIRAEVSLTFGISWDVPAEAISFVRSWAGAWLREAPQARY